MLTRSPDVARRRTAALRLGALVLAASLSAAPPSRAEEGNIFSNLFKYGGTTVPRRSPKP
ncbi:hypothetical protein ACU4GA_06250 [Methylobacterium oryzae CBMB20]